MSFEDEEGLVGHSEGARTAPFAFVAHAVEWLAERIERDKIERLHRHLPWHEFR